MNPRSASHQIRLLAIVGPTAVGKTALSIAVGQRLGGEVISADSRQIYRGMDIGTAKASLDEQAAVPHHLIDVVAPDEELTLAHYVRLAKGLVEDITSRGRLPIMAGGTGLYVRAVLEGWTVPEVPPNPTLRDDLERYADANGVQALHDRLRAVDPQAAEGIDARNVRRVIRALEVYEMTGQPISLLQRKEPPNWAITKVGLTMPRERLYERIDTRIDAMMQQGLEQEVRGLLDAGYGWDMPSMSALGYRQFREYLVGEESLQDAVSKIRKHTRRFVRQQYNWFRVSDPTIHWLDMHTLSVDEAAEQTSALVRKNRA